ncbi:MAG: DUF4097 family beta strand repeat-containing protein [Planctomycetota bacterium]
MRNVVPRIILLAAMGAFVTLAAAAVGQEYRPGEKVVALRDAVLKVGAQNVATVRAGESLAVERVQGKWLWVRADQTRGWIQTASVARPGAAAISNRQLGAGQPIRLAGRRVAIYNLVGDVEIVHGTGDAVEVDVRRGGRDAARLRIATGEIDGRQTLRVIYPGSVIITPPAVYKGVSAGSRVHQDGTFSKGTAPGGREVVIVGSGNIGMLSMMSPVPTGPRLEAHAQVTVQVPAGGEVEVNLVVGNVRATAVQDAAKIDINSGSGNVTAHDIGGMLVVNSHQGTVDATTIRGGLEIDNAQGDVTVRNVGNALRITSRQGNLQVVQTEGNVEIDHRQGKVSVCDIGGTLALKAQQGAIEVTGVQGSVKIENRQGNITVRDFHDQVDIDTRQGDVTLHVPPGLGAKVELETSRGMPEIKMPLTDLTEEKGRVRGILGDGSGRIRVKTNQGQIRLLPN